MNKAEMTERGKLKEKQRELLIKRENLISKAKTLKLEYQSLLTIYQPRINELQEEANQLAPQFRRLFEQSQEAYRNEEKALAKSLSLEGRAVQAQCEALNEQANAMRQELKSLLDRINSCYGEAKEIQLKINEQQSLIQTLRPTRINGFERSGVMNNLEIEYWLDEFPAAVFTKIETIAYDKNLFWESATGKVKVPARGKTMPGKKGNVILIGKQIGGTPEKQLKSFKEALSHEIGHVVYEHFLIDEQKADWYAWHQETQLDKFISLEAIENDAEEFAECFRFFKLEPAKLETNDGMKYNFVKEIYQSLEGETQ